jgi:hypothetical protein
MKMWCQHFFRNSLKALGICFVDCSDWRQTLHVTTVLDLHTIRGVLAYFLNKSHGLHWQTRLEEYHFGTLVCKCSSRLALLTALSVQLDRREEGLSGWFGYLGELLLNFSLDISFLVAGAFICRNTIRLLGPIQLLCILSYG